MPKLHERVRKLIPQSVKDMVPEAVKEKIRPPAWRAPTNPVPEWAQGERGETKWTLGSPAQVWAQGGDGSVTAVQDSKGYELRQPVKLAYGTEGTVTAVGPDFLVFQPKGSQQGFRVSKTDLIPGTPENERKWGRRLIEVGGADLEVPRARS